MKAVQFTRFGSPGVLEVVELPVPEPGPGEVLVRVHAAGVNFFEVLMRADRYAVTPDLPMSPGVEVAGTIERAGPGADRSLIGMRVAVPLFAIGRGSGGYAEFVAVDSGPVMQLPDAVSFEAAAGLMVQGLTALHLLRRSPAKGKNVLVSAAAGGVGSLLVQLARRDGAKMVIAAASSNEKRALSLSLGADHAADYTAPGWQGHVKRLTGGLGADIIYETVGGAFSRAALDALAPCGELVLAAMGRFGLQAADVEHMLDDNQSIKGFSLLPLVTPQGVREDLAELFELAAAGALTVFDGGRFPLHQAAEAHRAIEGRRAVGKVVLVP
ncbi:zinc-binding alcohol dehydrogenase family protein [Rhizobium leguminosarum]|uniref:Dehydrogenase/oxidoreductase n=1 Tax=Rhizobium johnstonii (strain DSM 114642 / LMG 32736 / 3841) TaxID=216596 RepID=Q1MDH8_RHIJ3|nr:MULTISPECIES: zinc-binding dehydrogenase [Rhizobium]MBY5373555.1 zinc-binding dehydrogenase [Rhizobium leguminosarum]NEI91752.1 zinc-binding dehydrogenase [Rhizobium leguminosarum]NEJ77205.1 zinc-binding dehydrogenase [Rhizobium leguminosarum]TBF41621.1 zinc-binding alcohol dehydrogenase family protein [Rhizobium leguminosarum]TBF53207.1 zinc-binding alcohol dehydrogenase family protein [Rhizobium leguminosarum]